MVALMMMKVDEKAVAAMLWQVKAIATKEFESLPHDSKRNLFYPPQYETTTTTDTTTSEDSYEVPDRRKRTVSVESMDLASYTDLSPLILPKTITLMDSNKMLVDSTAVGTLDSTEEEYWPRNLTEDFDDGDLSTPSLSQENNPTAGLITQKYGKRKCESFVGLATKGGKTIRASLKKKFSWKQFPELEGFLIDNQDDYFDFSSRNYTAEQRKYNNSLTRGLLDLAAEEGYVFEEFTFSMVRDRIRCYYKSHSQSAKKKRRR